MVTLLLGQHYHVVVLKLFTDDVPHVDVVVDSVESNVIIVHLKQTIHWDGVVTDDELWKINTVVGVFENGQVYVYIFYMRVCVS